MEYFTVENLVWALFFAILSAIIYSFFMQKCLSKLASKLLEKNVCSEENASTLEGLGYKKGIYSAVTGFFAENGNYISKVIVKIKKEKNDAADELLFVKKEPVRYYIPEEKNDKRLEKHIKDSISLSKLALLIALLTAIAFAASTVIDMLGDYASTLTENESGVVGVTEDETTLLEEQEQFNKAEELEKKEQEELEKIEEQAKNELEAAQNEAASAGAADVSESDITSEQSEQEKGNE